MSMDVNTSKTTTTGGKTTVDPSGVNLSPARQPYTQLHKELHKDMLEKNSRKGSEDFDVDDILQEYGGEGENLRRSSSKLFIAMIV